MPRTTQGGPAEARRILVIRLSALGDVIRTLPLLPPLARRFPAAAIDWLLEPAQRPVVAPQPLVSGILEFPRGELSRHLAAGHLARAARAARGLVKEIRRRRYDVVVDAQGTYKSGLLARLSGAPMRVGWARGAAREYLPGAATHPVRPDPPRQSRVSKALALLGPLGADPGLAGASLPPDPQAAAAAAAIWQAAGPGPRVVLAPGASARQDYKRWPAERFAALAAGLSESGAVVRIAWGPDEEALGRRVAEASGEPARLLPATSLPVLAEVLRQARLLVGNDSGPMHLAWLVGCRVVALYGPTDPVLNAPWGSGHRQVAVPDDRRRAVGRDPALMAEIPAAEVLAAAREILAETADDRPPA